METFTYEEQETNIIFNNDFDFENIDIPEEDIDFDIEEFKIPDYSFEFDSKIETTEEPKYLNFDIDLEKIFEEKKQFKYSIFEISELSQLTDTFSIGGQEQSQPPVYRESKVSENPNRNGIIKAMEKEYMKLSADKEFEQNEFLKSFFVRVKGKEPKQLKQSVESNIRNQLVEYQLYHSFYSNSLDPKEYTPFFITLTAPSKYKRFKQKRTRSKNQKIQFVDNPKYDGVSTNKDIYVLLKNFLRRLYKNFSVNKKWVKAEQWTVVEYMKDFTPHTHSIIYVPTIHKDLFTNFFLKSSSKVLNPKGVDIVEIKSPKHALSYQSKYMQKSLKSIKSRKILDGWKKKDGISRIIKRPNIKGLELHFVRRLKHSSKEFMKLRKNKDENILNAIDNYVKRTIIINGEKTEYPAKIKEIYKIEVHKERNKFRRLREALANKIINYEADKFEKNSNECISNRFDKIIEQKEEKNELFLQNIDYEYQYYHYKRIKKEINKDKAERDYQVGRTEQLKTNIINKELDIIEWNQYKERCKDLENININGQNFDVWENKISYSEIDFKIYKNDVITFEKGDIQIVTFEKFRIKEFTTVAEEKNSFISKWESKLEKEARMLLIRQENIKEQWAKADLESFGELDEDDITEIAYEKFLDWSNEDSLEYRNGKYSETSDLHNSLF